MSEPFVKKPCKHCPYRNDVKPFLHPERGAQLALLTTNPYNEFHCHKTTVSDEEYGGDGFEMVTNNSSKLCAGFLTLMAQDGHDMPDGFEPSYDIVYTDVYEMIDAYENKNDNR